MTDLHRLRGRITALVLSEAWRRRAALWGGAVAVALVAILFAKASDAAFHVFQRITTHSPWWALLLTPGIFALLAWLTSGVLKPTRGSGIPQVIAALDKADEPFRKTNLSPAVSAGKLLLTSLSLLGGASVGREGPTVHVGASLMYLFGRWFGFKDPRELSHFLLAGGAAGIAAAFNTPLGGIVFAIEELSRRLQDRSSGLMLAAIVIAGLVAVSAFGNLSYFGRVRAEVLSWSLLLPGALVALACGLLGGLMSRLMLASFTGLPDRFCAYRRKRPVTFAAICGFVVAVIAVVSDGAAVGVGHEHTKQLLDQATDPGGSHQPLLFTGLKFIASWLSAWAGVPGGVFGPSLSLGAGLGADVAWLLDSPHGVALIALGMCGFLAAVTQTPITAMIIVMEMTDGHNMVLSLMASALLASLVSRMISRPLYSTMSLLMMRSLRDRTDPAPQPEPLGR